MNQIPEDASTPGSGPPATSGSPPCPLDLLPGSTMERALMNRDGTSPQSEDKKWVERLRQWMRGDYKKIQTGYLMLVRSESIFENLPGRCYQASLGQPPGDRPPNSVLRFTLSHRAGFAELATGFRDGAMSQYLEDPDSYLDILGELLPDEFLDDANQHHARNMYQRGDHRTAADDWHVFEERLQQRCSNSLSLIHTGFPLLDDALGGGMHGRVFLAGHPATGKTALALDIARRAIEIHPEISVILLSLDMSKDTVYERLLVAEAGVDQRALRTGRLSSAESDQVREASDRLHRLILPRMRVLDESAFPLDTGFSLEIMRQRLTERCTRSVVVVIDNFQRLPIPNAATELERDVRRLDVICALQQWTESDYHPEGVPFLIISRVPKDAPQTNLTTAHLLGSTDLGSRASSVIFLWADTNRKQTGDVVPMTLSITKARDGGMCTQIPMQFEHRRCRFVQADAQKPNLRTRAGKSQRTDTHLDPLAGG